MVLSCKNTYLHLNQMQIYTKLYEAPRNMNNAEKIYDRTLI